MLIFLATGTILFTLVMGSVALPIILKYLPPPGEPATVREERLAREASCHAAMSELTLSDEEVQTHSPEWVAMHQEVMGHLMQEYRNRLQLLDDATGVATSLESAREAPEVVQQRKQRYVLEIEMRLRCIRAERDAVYAERHKHLINDETLRTIVSELDLQEISMRKRQLAARRAAGLDAKTTQQAAGH
ncbi:hypothetical protein SDC9_110585 [bioreactor metagenome]|uniref:Na+/H+ antiporter n=1 Tax=bioreactor metagenome TaxID=1076179 RepID=A0A645BKG1_9ZZZZ